MPVPGFEAEHLDEDGGLRWVSEIAGDNGYVLHAVQGLTAQQALALVGGKLLRTLEPGELTSDSPEDEWTTVVHLAVQDQTSESDLLVAGEGAPGWAFVLDLSGMTVFEMDELTHNPQGGFRGRAAAGLPPGPRTATSFTCTINGDEIMRFSDGETEHHLDGWEDPPSGAAVPAVLGTAFQAAGRFGSPDHQAGLRALCALAGLIWTPEELRRQPLHVGYF